MTNDDYNDPFEQVGDVPVFDWNAAATARRKERDAEREAASLAAHQAVVREAVERVQGEAGEVAE